MKDNRVSMVGTAETFLNYNVDNVLKHALAVEDHLRHLKQDYQSEEASCLQKHLLSLSEQAEEGISHASELDEKEKIGIFRKVNEEAQKIKADVTGRKDPAQLIRDIRDLRRTAEKLNPDYNLEKCTACGDITGFSNASDEKGLYAKTPHYTSEPTMRKADTKLLTKVVAPVYAGELVGEAGTMGVDYLASMYPSTPLGQYLGATIDAVVAIALTYAVMITKSEKWQLIEAAIGGYFVADGVQKLSQPYVPVAARTFYMAPTGAGQVMVTASPAIGKYTY